MPLGISNHSHLEGWPPPGLVLTATVFRASAFSLPWSTPLHADSRKGGGCGGKPSRHIRAQCHCPRTGLPGHLFIYHNVSRFLCLKHLPTGTEPLAPVHSNSWPILSTLPLPSPELPSLLVVLTVTAGNKQTNKNQPSCPLNPALGPSSWRKTTKRVSLCLPLRGP